jgi:hypothetical protein
LRLSERIVMVVVCGGGHGTCVRVVPHSIARD